MSTTEPPEPLDLDAYDYALPPDRIAQSPPVERDGGRMLTLDRAAGAIRHGVVCDLADALDPRDVLVVNATRVLPARLRGHKESGGGAEALLLAEPDAAGHVPALVRARGRLRAGQKLFFERGADRASAEIKSVDPDGSVVLAFERNARPLAMGEMPLPPYIRRGSADPADAERYQTTFARVPGSIAAPTAGLHLSERLLAAIAARGVERAEVVLHVGPGTFRPIGPDQLATGRLHGERFALSEATADAIARARLRGGRVVAIGTTTTRVLESRARDDGTVVPGEGTTQLFVRPGFRFRVVDALLTNFHLPRSSLLLLVAAFAGREAVLHAYAEAIAADYRFYSYGDAMWIR